MADEKIVITISKELVHAEYQRLCEDYVAKHGTTDKHTLAEKLAPAMMDFMQKNGEKAWLN